jgi:hypothetical protein
MPTPTVSRRRTWKIGPFYLGWEPAGVVSDCPCWLIVHRCWLYGPWPTLWPCLRDLMCEWQNDRHLVG